MGPLGKNSPDKRGAKIVPQFPKNSWGAKKGGAHFLGKKTFFKAGGKNLGSFKIGGGEIRGVKTPGGFQKKGGIIWYKKKKNFSPGGFSGGVFLKGGGGGEI